MENVGIACKTDRMKTPPILREITHVPTIHTTVKFVLEVLERCSFAPIDHRWETQIFFEMIHYSDPQSRTKYSTHYLMDIGTKVGNIFVKIYQLTKTTPIFLENRLNCGSTHTSNGVKNHVIVDKQKVCDALPQAIYSNPKEVPVLRS